MKTIVVIPTYDEKDNVGPMAEAVLKNDVELLFVDDNSPDGTGAVIDALATKEPRIHVLHREKKEGLGRAYVAGFSKALELGADLVVQMDCDFSHDPKDVARQLRLRLLPSNQEIRTIRNDSPISSSARGMSLAARRRAGLSSVASFRALAESLSAPSQECQ